MKRVRIEEAIELCPGDRILSGSQASTLASVLEHHYQLMRMHSEAGDPSWTYEPNVLYLNRAFQKLISGEGSS